MAASKWEPVAQLLAHMAADDDLMLRWGLARHGDVRSGAGRAALMDMQRNELVKLISAVQDRAEDRETMPLPVRWGVSS